MQYIRQRISKLLSAFIFFTTKFIWFWLEFISALLSFSYLPFILLSVQYWNIGNVTTMIWTIDDPIDFSKFWVHGAGLIKTFYFIGFAINMKQIRNRE